MQSKRLFLALVVMTLAANLLSQSISPLAKSASAAVGKAETRAALPKSAAEIEAAIGQTEIQLGSVREQLAAAQSVPGRETIALGATIEELTERGQMLQQLALALDQRLRYLRSISETRSLHQELAHDREIWRGFNQPPTLVTAEQLTEAVSAQRLEFRSGQLLLSIYGGDAARFADRLKDSLKQLCLVHDQTEQAAVRTAHHQWQIERAQLRVRANEAAVETSEIARLLTWESVENQKKHLEFLEAKLAVARSLAKITQTDLDNINAQINEKKRVLQGDLKLALAADEATRQTRDEALTRLRAAQEGEVLSAGYATNLAACQAAADVARSRAETSRQNIEVLRGFLQLSDYAQTVWQDRVWATERHSLAQLRAKQRHYQQTLQGLVQWKTLMESSLSAISEQVLRHSLKKDDPMLSAVEREAAQQTFATLQERASICLRAVGALVFTEDLTARLHTELSHQAAGLSISDKLRSAGSVVASVARRIWNTELYIAEDSVIAGGQKVSIPRSITLAKVVIAVTILLAGLLIARWVYGVGKRLAMRWGAEKQSAEIPAKAIAGTVATLSLVVAMASVRIPWTVFAFMGGALAIAAGFGAQTLINNFISGVILLCERSIRVDDIVEVDEQRGKVVQMGFRSSLIERGDGIEVLIPNSQFLEKKVVNWTLSSDLVRQVVTVHVAYGASPAMVTSLIGQAAAEHPYVCQKPAADVLFEEFGDNGLIFSLKFWMRLCPTTDGGKVRSDLRHRINALFDQAGIVVAFPQRDIHLDSSRPLEIKVVRSNGERRVSERAITN